MKVEYNMHGGKPKVLGYELIGCHRHQRSPDHTMVRPSRGSRRAIRQDMRGSE